LSESERELREKQAAVLTVFHSVAPICPLCHQLFEHLTKCPVAAMHISVVAIHEPAKDGGQDKRAGHGVDTEATLGGLDRFVLRRWGHVALENTENQDDQDD
jgi:hypothetical protein